jgi:aminocarboxymuconate-semialdehyde decarboxylase
MNIDVHAHFVPQALLDDVAARRHAFPSVEATMDNGSLRVAFCGGEPKRGLMSAMSDVDRRRQWLSQQQLDRQIVGGWLDLFGYELPANEGADWSRLLNEHMLRAVKGIDAFVPLATVPMQSGKHAARVLEEALDAGFHGAMIGTQPKGATGVLDDADLDAFWETANARKATLLLHPTFGAHDPRLKAYDLVSAVGRATDTTTAVARLLFSGHFLRYPDIRFVIAHGGGALPMLLGRLRRSFETNPGKRADPVEGFKRLYFDSAVYDARVLRFVCEMAGVSRIMMGTDQPFAIAENEPVKLIDCCGFHAAERAAVLGGTAAEIFHIPGNA